VGTGRAGKRIIIIVTTARLVIIPRARWTAESDGS